MTDRIPRSFGEPRAPRHPFEEHEEALQALLRPSKDARTRSDATALDHAINALYEAAIQAATGFCERLNLRPYRERATEAVHDWFCQLRPHRAKGYRPDLPFFPYAYVALWYIHLNIKKCEVRRAACPLADDHTPRRREPVHLLDLLAVEEAVQDLPKTCLDAISLRFYLGLSSTEAAHLLNITTGAFDTRVHRAITVLREKLAHPNGS